MTDDIILTKLKDGLPGLTKVWRGFLCEASSYCLECNKHKPGTNILFFGDVKKSCKIVWQRVTSTQVKNSWNDEQELTEYGATGIAILGIINFTDFTIMQRSRKGPGFDYWLNNKYDNLLFQQSARMEVSGIMRGNINEIEKRGTIWLIASY